MLKKNRNGNDCNESMVRTDIQNKTNYNCADNAIHNDNTL